MQTRPPARDHYELLQVIRTADLEVIRAAYRALAQRYHPDLGGTEAQMAALNDAWAVLRDRQARAAYDRQLAIAADRAGAPVDIGHTTIITPPPGAGSSGGTVLDYGRYQGWSLAQLARHDPDYLRWLERTPAGRAYRSEIESLLDQARPGPGPAQPRARAGIFGRMPTAAR